MVNERLLYMDALKLFAITLVVMGHVTLFMAIPQDWSNADRYSNPLNLYIYAFHMPLFMMVSGYFSSKILEGRGNLKLKFLQLIVPCITLAVIFFLFGITSQNMWYLWSLFICYAIFYLCNKYFGTFNRMLVCGGMVVGFFLFPLIAHLPKISSYKVDFMLPFFFVGMLLKGREEKILSMKYLLLWICIFLIMLLFWRVDYIWYISKPNWFPVKDMFLSKSLMFDGYSLWCYMYRFFTGLFGSLAFISLFYHLGHTAFGKQLYEKVGRYGIYSLHIYIIQTFLVELNIFGIDISSFEMTGKYLCIFIFTISFVIVSILIAKILERNIFVNSYLFGKFK